MSDDRQTENEGRTWVVTCSEARLGRRRHLIGAHKGFKTVADAMVFARVAVGLYTRILEASRMGWWQFWYRVEVEATTEQHRTVGEDGLIELEQWHINSNRDDLPSYTVVLAVGGRSWDRRPVDPDSDLQTLMLRSVGRSPD